MQFRNIVQLFTAVALLSGLCAPAHAQAALKPYQQAALDKILATAPPEAREMMRTQMEMTLANMTEEQVAMIVAQFEGQDSGNDSSGEEDYGDDTWVGDGSTGDEDSAWGKGEEHFEAGLKQSIAYMNKASDLHDKLNADMDAVRDRLEDEWRRKNEYGSVLWELVNTVGSELVGLPRGRTETTGELRSLVEDQDRLTFRSLVESRARYRSLEYYAKEISQPVNSPLVQDMKHIFVEPISEDEALKRIRSGSEKLVKLVESASLEKHKIERTRYPDEVIIGEGVSSEMRTRDLNALTDRSNKAAKEIGQEIMSAYNRGSARSIKATADKVRPYLPE